MRSHSESARPGCRREAPEMPEMRARSRSAREGRELGAAAARAAPLSSNDLPRRPPSHDDLPIPTADHDLRDIFESPMGTGASIEDAAVGSRKQVLSDAEALFRDEPERRRKPRGAEARLQ